MIIKWRKCFIRRKIKTINYNKLLVFTYTNKSSSHFANKAILFWSSFICQYHFFAKCIQSITTHWKPLANKWCNNCFGCNNECSIHSIFIIGKMIICLVALMFEMNIFFFVYKKYIIYSTPWNITETLLWTNKQM